MIETFLPHDRVARALTLSTAAHSLSSGVFYTVSALYFTRVIGLEATTVGLGLGIAGGVGVVASYAGGWLSDRVGAHHVQSWAMTLNGLAMLAYTFAADALVFVLVACVAVGARSVQGSAKQAIIARWYVGPDRVTLRARMRVVTNVCIGLGTVTAAAALVVDTAAAYRAAMIAAGALLLVAAVPVVRLPYAVPALAATMTEASRRPTDAGQPTRGPSPWRDRTYVASVGLNAVVAMHFGLQTIGVPLWIATTAAPTAMVSVLLVLNTVVVVVLQVRVSRGTHDIRRAGIAVRQGSWLLAAACVAYAAAGYGDVVTACALLVVAALVHGWGEVLGEAGGWGMAFGLADTRRAGAYQGLTQTGYAVAAMVSPILVTATAIEHGTAGWLVLGGLLAAAGTGAAWVARRAAVEREGAADSRTVSDR
ncbi:MFS transporter [Mumia sp. zg.B53]|uniref:MFS transporter n=1 Tax=unclassified Mumia TaxID=2621872 RepID=UPI001C6F39D8|nr:MULTISPECIES: MFS transporter [unclassified Mumia]MBW9210873.1 MFS transporter [Mumia sp. zg.B21]MBW9215438.1 MFS transporter [Mumia sp. zg.B53]